MAANDGWILGCYCSDYMSSGQPCPPGECPNMPADTIPAPAPEQPTIRNLTQPDEWEGSEP